MKLGNYCILFTDKKKRRKNIYKSLININGNNFYE